MEEEAPDLVISDVMMPQVDGYQFLAQLREDDRYQALPEVFLTAKGMTGDRIQGYQAGCDAYLSKPFDPEELEAIVKNLLERRQSQIASTSESAKLEELAQDIKEIKAKLGSQPQLTTTPLPMKIDLTPREQSVWT